jgi:hypothetical protein
MTEVPSRTCGLLVVLVLTTAAATAMADPIVVVTPVSSVELVDFAPIDGLDLQAANSQFVARGPEAETRVLYDFRIADLSAVSPRKPIFFQATRTGFKASSCAGLSPCPDMTRFDVYAFAAGPSVGIGDYNRGTFLTRFDTIPPRGQAFSVDVTGFLAGLEAAHVDFVGFAVRPASRGLLPLSDGQLAATPEPGSIGLLMLGLAFMARRRFADLRKA